MHPQMRSRSPLELTRAGRRPRPRDADARRRATPTRADARRPSAMSAGYCAKTGTGADGSCSFGIQGFWQLSMAQASSQAVARKVCRDLCSACPRCNYVSVAAAHQDCSWFHECDLSALRKGVSGFTSEAVFRANVTRGYGKGGLVVPGSWRGQYLQDRLVLQLLGCQRGGYYVDLAANDAVDLSNTFVLDHDFGWRGLCIEPNPRYWERLKSLRSCKLVPHAVADKPGELPFVLPAGGRHFGIDSGAFGGLVRTGAMAEQDPFVAKVQHHAGRTVVNVSVRTLREVLETEGAPTRIDVLSLDVEGAEDLAMSTFPWLRSTVRVLLIERPSQLLQSTLRRHGYVRHRSHGLGLRGDQVWVHPEVARDAPGRSKLHC